MTELYPTDPKVLLLLSDDEWDALLTRLENTHVPPRRVISLPRGARVQKRAAKRAAMKIPEPVRLVKGKAGRRGQRVMIDGVPLKELVIEAIRDGLRPAEIVELYQCTRQYVSLLKKDLA